MIHIHWGWVVFCIWAAVSVPLWNKGAHDTGAMRGLSEMLAILAWTVFILVLSLFLKVFL